MYEAAARENSEEDFIKMREIVLDSETTGFDPYAGHKIVELACIEIFNYLPTGKVFHTYINPLRSMPNEAYQVHGLSEDFLKDHPTFEAIAHKFLEFIEDATLVIHNAEFDLKFIRYELENAGFEISLKNEVVDTLKVARQKFPGSPASLDALCKRFKIDLSARTKHGALLDSELLCDVYLELMGGRQQELALDVGTKQKLSVSLPATYSLRREPRHFTLKEEEYEAHKRLLQDIHQPIWTGV